jgi:2-oxoisovalerate ferredoxin oxidoreductase alpha subunit
LEAFNHRLQAKYAQIEAREQRAELYQTEDAEIVLVAYGISSRVAMSAVTAARGEGLPVGLVRPKRLYPFPTDVLRRLIQANAKALIAVEMSNGQLRDDLRLAIDCQRPVELVNRMGGNLMTLSEVMSAIHETCRRIRG